jgi:AcrR family transcriptional regulator
VSTHARTPYTVVAKGRLREAILDAAYEVFVAHGYVASRMADVAATVGVSRQTVYNEFGNKEGLAAALVLRETGRFMEGIVAELDAHDEPREAVEAATLFTFAQAAANPLLKAVLTPGGDEELLPFLTTRSEPVLLTARRTLAEHLRRHWPDTDPGEVTVAAEAAVRLVLSHLMMPTDPPEVVAERLGRLVIAYLAGEGLDGAD